MYLDVDVFDCFFNKPPVLLFQPYGCAFANPSGNENRLTGFNSHHERGFGVHEIT